MELTTKNIRQLFITRLWPGVGSFWTWWTTELLAMLPEKARSALRPGGTCLFLELDGAYLVASHGETRTGDPLGRYLLESGKITPVNTADDELILNNVREIVLCLPPDKVLVKQLNLPLATEENLREVLAFEMDRQTPFTVDQVYYDYAITARNPAQQTLELSLVLTPHRELDEILTALTEYGIHPNLVAVHCNTADELHNVNLLPETFRNNKKVTPGLVNIAAGLLALLLLAGAISLPVLAQRQKIKQLEPQLEIAETKAEVASKLRDKLDRLTWESQFLVNRKQSSLLALQVMDELTRILPDDTWIFQMQIRESEVQIQGQSASAAALIPLIESSDILHNARFRSPVTQVPRSDLERFHLSASTKPSAP